MSLPPSSGGMAAGHPPHQSLSQTTFSFEIAPDTSGFAMSDFLAQLEDYTPTLPDSIANHYLQMAGFESTDTRICRLISIAAQKFISDIANEAYTHCKLKASVPQGKGAKTKVEKKLTLTTEELIPVLAEYGIIVKKPPYYM